MLRTQEEKLQQMYREKVEAPKENESQLQRKAHKVLFIAVLSAALPAAAAACITVVTLHLL